MVKALAEGFDVRAAARRVELVCLDLDGTLLDPDKRVSDVNRAAVRRAHEAGLTVAIASGRHPFSAEEVSEDLGLPFTAVCLSGAWAVLDGREVFRCGLDEKTVEAVAGIAAEVGNYVALSGSDFNLTAGHIERKNDGMAPSARRYQHFDSYEGLLDAARGPYAGKILKIAINSRDATTYQALRERLDALSGIDAVNSDTQWVDVTAAGCSKASGIRALADALGLSMSQVAAVGDDENDICALSAVGLGIAMENALPQVKAVADALTSDNARDGVAQALDCICSARSEGDNL